MKIGPSSWEHQDTLFRYDGQRRMDQMKVEAGTSGGPLQEWWRWDVGMGGEGHLLTEKYYELSLYDDDGSHWHSLTNYYGLAGTKIGVPEADFSGSYENAGFDAQYSFTYDTGHNRSVDSVDNGSEFFTTSYTVQPSSHRYAAVDGQEYFYDGEGNLRFDGRFRYRYDFKNRLSQVYLYVPPESGGSSMAMTSGSGLNKGKTTYLVDSEELERLDEAAEKAWPALQSVLSAAQASKAKGGGAPSVTSGTAGDGSYEPIAVYGYDAFNRRVFRYLVGEGERYYYAYDGWREIEETLQIGAGSVQEERLFVWGAGLDELVMSGHKVNGVWNHYFVHQDRMGSLHHVSSSMTFVAGETWSYGPYGDVVGAPQAPPDVPPYLWAGRRVDPETQLYYFRNRYYSPGLGRFMTGDPLGVWQDIGHYGNPYGFCGNNPVAFSDPTGLQIGYGMRNFMLHQAARHNPMRVPSNNPGDDAGNYGALEESLGNLCLTPDFREKGLDELLKDAAKDRIDGPGNVPRFVLTKSGWVDLTHFFSSACVARSYGSRFARATMATIEFGQAVLGSNSANRPEDEAGNRLGATFPGDYDPKKGFAANVLEHIERNMGEIITPPSAGPQHHPNGER